MGATAVLEMAAATPPARKSLTKDTAASAMAGGGGGRGEAKRSEPKQGESGRSAMRGLSSSSRREAALPVTGRAPEMAAYIVTERHVGGDPRAAPSRSPIGWGKRAWPAQRDGAAPAAGGGARPGSRGSPAAKRRWGTHRSTPGMRAPRQPPDPPHAPVVVTALSCQRPPHPRRATRVPS